MGEKTLREKAQDTFNDKRETTQIYQIEHRLEQIWQHKEAIEKLDKEISEIEGGKVFFEEITCCAKPSGLTLAY